MRLSGAAGRGWIEARIPHAGRMCLLDEVIHFDAEHIACSSGAHRAADHPLRAHGRLGIASGIELAAQTMAIHGALTAQSPAARPRAGFLAALRGVRMYAARLDDVASPLICEAVRVAGDETSALYDFTLRSADACLLKGRATVVLDAGAVSLDADPAPSDAASAVPGAAPATPSA
jgi:predicted hotdog family 3-hydroxylacyl-ACP dehydratase